jgi:hypothetical protein
VTNTRWYKANPEVAKNFISAIYKAALWRSSNLEESMRIAEKFCAMPDGTFDHNSFYSPTAADYKDWFANTNAAGYGFLRSLYNERVPNIPQGTTPKSFEDAFDLTYMLQAIREIQ